MVILEPSFLIYRLIPFVALTTVLLSFHDTAESGDAFYCIDVEEFTERGDDFYGLFLTPYANCGSQDLEFGYVYDPELHDQAMWITFPVSKSKDYTKIGHDLSLYENANWPS